MGYRDYFITILTLLKTLSVLKKKKYGITVLRYYSYVCRLKHHSVQIYVLLNPRTLIKLEYFHYSLELNPNQELVLITDNAILCSFQGRVLNIILFFPQFSGRGGERRGGELKCYIHTYRHTYRQTYRQSL